MKINKLISKSLSILILVFMITSISSTGVSAAEYLGLQEQEVDLVLQHETEDKASSANDCLDGKGIIKEVNGEKRLFINLKAKAVGPNFGYLDDLYYYENEEAYKLDKKSELIVESTNDEGYATEISIPMTSKLKTIYIGFKIAIPSMPSMPNFNMSHIARLIISYGDEENDEENNNENETIPDDNTSNNDGQVVLQDGEYLVPTSFVKADSNDESKANLCLEQESKLVVKNGVSRIYLTLKEAEIMGIKSAITELYYYSNEAEYKKGNKLNVTVEEVNSETSNPKVVSFELPSNSEYVYIASLVNFGHDTLTTMRLKVDYNNVKEYEETYKDGTYKVDISLLNASKDELSMANNALDKTAILKIENGVAIIKIGSKPLTLGTITASLQELQYENVDGTYSIADITKKSEDGNPTEFSFELPSYEEILNVKVNPMVAMMGNTPIAARLKIDYSTMTEVSHEEGSIESDDSNEGNDEVVNGNNNTNTNNVVVNDSGNESVIKTNDSNNIMSLVIISMVSLSVIVFYVIRKKGVMYENNK